MILDNLIIISESDDGIKKPKDRDIQANSTLINLEI